MSEISTKRKIIYLSIPFLLVISFLFGIEIYVRNTRPYISSVELFTNVADPQRLDGEGVNVFEGDVDLGWKLAANLDSVYWDYTSFSTNSDGLRYHADIGPKKENSLRIISIGDSVTFGYRVPVAFENNSNGIDKTHVPYPLLMEEGLKELNPNKIIEVIPLGVPGYTTHQGLKWLENIIVDLDPDIVTVQFGWNDTDLRSSPDRISLANTKADLLKRNLITKSQTITYLAKYLSDKRVESYKSGNVPYPASVTRVSKNEYVSNLQKMNQITSAHEATLVIVGIVYRDDISNPRHAKLIKEWRDASKQMASEKDIHYIEIEKLTERGHPENKDLFGELIHPNIAGHRILASELLELLKNSNLLPDYVINI